VSTRGHTDARPQAAQASWRDANMKLFMEKSIESITADEYARAFRAIPDKLRDEYLQAFLAAPDYTTTAQDLAQKLGKKDYRAWNVSFGTCAGKVARFLGYSRAACNGFWLFILADWAEDQPGAHGHTAFVLREPVIEALRQLGFPVPGLN
jgi:hypothetical protein